MATMMVDQRELQRRGGRCALFPVSCMVALLVERASLSLEALTVFDVTYGEGRFYAYKRPRLLIGADIAVHRWVVKPDMFIPRPAWSSYKPLQALEATVDMVVVDPPWSVRGNSARRHFGIDMAVGGPEAILWSAAKAAETLDARYLLVHYKQQWLPQGWTIVVEAEWTPVTRYNTESRTWWTILRR